MPQIKEFTSSVDKLQPTDRGTDAYAAAGRRIGGFYDKGANAIEAGARAQADAAGDVAKSFSGVAKSATDALEQQETYAGHREISMGAAKGAQLFSNLSDQWQATAAEAFKNNPNDPTVAAKFREQVLEPALQNFKDSYSNTDLGQKWAEQHVETMRAHMFEKTAADMSSLAEQAVRTNVTQLGNATSNAARKNPDQHTLNYLLDQVDSSVDAIIASSPNLKGVAAAKVRMEVTEKIKEQAVKAMALGAMEKSSNPESVADTVAKTYPQYVNGQEIDQFAKVARFYKHQNETASRAARSEAEHNARTTFNADINSLELSLYDKEGNPVASPDSVKRLNEIVQKNPLGAALEPGRVRTMQEGIGHVIDKMNRPEPLGRVSHDTTMQLLKDIRSGKITDVGPIYEAFGPSDEHPNGKLNTADFKFVINEFKDLKTPQGEALGRDRTEFFKKYAGAVDGAMDYGGHSALGSQRMYAFEMDARRQEEDLRKAGKDPHQLYDPSSPNFIGNQVPKYQTTLTESMQYNKTISEQKAKGAAAPSKNLTGEGNTVTGVSAPVDIPRGMPMADILKNYKSGTKVRMYDGHTGVVP